jgi:hypothetical protein
MDDRLSLTLNLESPNMTAPNPVNLANDLLSVYREMGGKKKLAEISKDDPKFFKSLLTDLLRLQLREKEIELANRAAFKPNTVFIIKGLNDKGAKDVSVTEGTPEEVLRLRSSLFPAESGLLDEVHDEEEQPDG